MSSHPPNGPAPARRCDVAVIGGGLAGSAVAWLIKRRVPGARVVIFERDESVPPAGTLTARGTNATFFADELELEQELASEHLAMHGARFWWAPNSAASLDELLELGECSVPRAAAFHLDRARLATVLRSRAARAGVTCELGTTVEDVRLEAPRCSLRVRDTGATREVQCSWVVDASGASGTLGLEQLSSGLQLLTSEARWSGVRSWHELSPLASRPALRALAEHNFCGRGWRARLTPLSGGEHALLCSVDPQIAPELASELEELRGLQAHGRFVRTRAGLRELLRGASVDPASFSSRRIEAGYVEPTCGPNWFAVGDAAGLLDPFDGEPLTQLVATVRRAAQVIGEDLSGQAALDAADDWPFRASAMQRDYHHRACRLGEGAYLLHGDPTTLCAAASFQLAFQSLPFSEHTHGACAWIRARLVRLAEARVESGLYSTASSSRLDCSVSGGLPQLARGLQAWTALEFAGFREHFTPVAEDPHTSASARLQQYAAARAVR